jgi:hypothetical protein
MWLDQKWQSNMMTGVRMAEGKTLIWWQWWQCSGVTMLWCANAVECQSSGVPMYAPTSLQQRERRWRRSSDGGKLLSWKIQKHGHLYYFGFNPQYGIQLYFLIHSVFCLTTGPKPKRFLHIVRSRASSFKWEYPLLSLRSASYVFFLFFLSLSSLPSSFIR